MEKNPHVKKLLDLDEATKEKEQNLEIELDKLVDNCVHGERSQAEKNELEKFVAEHPELLLKLKEKLNFEKEETNDKELRDYIRDIQKTIFPMPDPNSIEGMRRQAEFQRAEIPVDERLISSNVTKYKNQKPTVQQEINKEIITSNTKLNEKNRLFDLMKSVEKEKDLNNVYKELMESLKEYPELKDDYIKMVLDLFTKSSQKDAFSNKTSALNKIWELLTNGTI